MVAIDSKTHIENGEQMWGYQREINREEHVEETSGAVLVEFGNLCLGRRISSKKKFLNNKINFIS